MRKFHIFLANTLFVAHCLFAIFILSGWIFPEIKVLYLAVLLIWISCWIFLGYCPPTKWEFMLRKKYNDNIDPNTEFIQHYAYTFFKKNISSRTVFIVGIITCAILLLLTFYVN
ncbi:DUF2784 family protein [Candidatus Nomurabacteria bacterium]|nr:DUF2784 family protein [Candidatus Nomurabacteria bacterium]